MASKVLPLVLLGGGTLLAYSALKGKNASAGLRNLISGQSPGMLTASMPIAGTPAGLDATGSGTIDPVGGSTSTAKEAMNKALGQTMCASVGWIGGQWTAFNNIVMAESGWNTLAENPSGAYGIPQALPGSKMASAGANWRTSAGTQIRWMIGYIKGRYKTPEAAWSFHLANGWY
jgi:hypothetical protein